MSKTRLFMILGNSSPYNEEGIIPSAMLSLYDDKGAWVFQRISPHLNEGEPLTHCWYSSESSLFDDAFLMISLFFNQSENIAKLAERLFNVDNLYEQREIDPENSRIISRKDLNSLYEANKEELAKQYCLKIVVVMLGTKAQHPGFKVNVNTRLRKSLIRSIREYGIKNFEICEATNENAWRIGGRYGSKKKKKTEIFKHKSTTHV